MDDAEYEASPLPRSWGWIVEVPFGFCTFWRSRERGLVENRYFATVGDPDAKWYRDMRTNWDKFHIYDRMGVVGYWEEDAHENGIDCQPLARLHYNPATRIGYCAHCGRVEPFSMMHRYQLGDFSDKTIKLMDQNTYRTFFEYARPFQQWVSDEYYFRDGFVCNDCFVTFEGVGVLDDFLSLLKRWYYEESKVRKAKAAGQPVSESERRRTARDLSGVGEGIAKRLRKLEEAQNLNRRDAGACKNSGSYCGDQTHGADYRKIDGGRPRKCAADWPERKLYSKSERRWELWD